jgi:DNA repair protein RecO (recombination protein O)
MDYKYQAIVLGKNDISETDRIYTLYTKEEGKIRVVGKGVRRPGAKLTGFLETLTAGEFFVAKNRGLGKITGAITTQNFVSIKNDYEMLARIFEIFKIFQKFITEQEKDEGAFKLLSDYLEEIERLLEIEHENISDKADILTLGFELKLFSLMGYRFQVGRCVLCGNRLAPGGNYFSIEKGGAVCFACSARIDKKMSMSDGAIKMIRLFMTNEVGNFVKLRTGKEDIKNLKRIIAQAVLWLAG